MSLTLLNFLTRSIAALANLFVTKNQGINTDLYVGDNVYLNAVKDDVTGTPDNVFIEWSS